MTKLNRELEQRYHARKTSRCHRERLHQAAAPSPRQPRPQPIRRYAQLTLGSSEDSDDFVDLVFDYADEDKDMDYAPVLELSGVNNNDAGCCFGGLRASLKDACGEDQR